MIVIFGQQDYAERLHCYLQIILGHPQTKMVSFPISKQNPSEYVFDFSRYDDELDSMDKSVPIYVAFGAKHRAAANNFLLRHGFRDVRLYDAKMDNELKKMFFKKTFTQKSLEFSLVDEGKSVVVYMAKSIVDKPLNNYPQNISSYIVPIHVGAVLVDEKIADVTDDTGDHISDRNRHYSETTALYWMWKNADADYLGLCHYRRHWENLDFIAGSLQNDMIDVVLPIPTLCVHSIYEDYMERYIPDVYPTMLEVLKKMSPEYYEASKEIYQGQVFYACNMLIAKRSALHDLCQWMFPVVMEIERRVGDLPDPYYNRYAGFCTERLITLYFLYNKQNWRIAHANKIFIE